MPFLEKFRLGQDRRCDPFEPHEDLAGQLQLFVYVTSRGGFSYLFPDCNDNEVIDAAESSIPVGYTQIWILEWITALRPKPAREVKASERRAAGDLKLHGAREGRSYILIAENGRCFGIADTLHRARAAAVAIGTQERVRIAVGRLKADVTWH